MTAITVNTGDRPSYKKVGPTYSGLLWGIGPCLGIGFLHKPSKSGYIFHDDIFTWEGLGYLNEVLNAVKNDYEYLDRVYVKVGGLGLFSDDSKESMKTKKLIRSDLKKLLRQRGFRNVEYVFTDKIDARTIITVNTDTGELPHLYRGLKNPPKKSIYSRAPNQPL